MLSFARGLSARSVMALSLVAFAVACSKDASTITASAPAAESPAGETPEDVSLAVLPIASFINPIAGSGFWADPYSNAARTAAAWRVSSPADAAQMDKLAREGSARWIGNWNANVQSDVDAATTTMTAAGKVPVFVAYNIPQRDCGGLSGGNSTAPAAYRSWVTAFANGIGARPAVVVLEPDALAAMDCLSSADRQTRLSLMKDAVQAFASKGNVTIYLDAGHPRWKSASTMAARLINAGVAQTQGFSLNVSNFHPTSDNVAYGTQISNLVGGKHFIVDTGRNGLGPTADFQWCNPAGRALGYRPTTTTGIPLVDAYMWIKTPGESDGACNGNPSAGVWMPSYALGLAQRAAY